MEGMEEGARQQLVHEVTVLRGQVGQRLLVLTPTTDTNVPATKETQPALVIGCSSSRLSIPAVVRRSGTVSSLDLDPLKPRPQHSCIMSGHVVNGNGAGQVPQRCNQRWTPDVVTVEQGAEAHKSVRRVVAANLFIPVRWSLVCKALFV